MMRTDDPIVASVRAARDRYAAKFGYNLKEIFKDIKNRQRTSGQKYTRYPPRLVTADHDSTAQPPTFEPPGPGFV